jgi:nucleoside-diphosphate-sugar epimerase
VPLVDQLVPGVRGFALDRVQDGGDLGRRLGGEDQEVRTIRNCSVAVVGGAGFLGSHLVNHLIEDRKCRVLVVDNLVAGRREWVHPAAEFVHADITESEDHLRSMFLKHKVKFCFNYAAWPYVVDSYDRPLHVFNVNAAGALKVINAAQEAGCEGILQVSSAELYGGMYEQMLSDKNAKMLEVGGINENYSVTPHSSYGAAKAAVDALVQVRWREAKTPCIALRQFNCVGERETHPYVVPEIVSQLNNQRTYDVMWELGHRNKNGTVKLGNNSFRDFLYAGDAVRIAVELLERGQFGEVYNLGSEAGIKIYDLSKVIGKLMGFAEVKVEEDPVRKRRWEIWHLQSDNSKMWKAVKTKEWKWAYDPMPLEEALQRTIKWFNENGRRWPWEK